MEWATASKGADSQKDKNQEGSIAHGKVVVISNFGIVLMENGWKYYNGLKGKWCEKMEVVCARHFFCESSYEEK